MAIDFTKLGKAKKQLEDRTSGNIVYASKISAGKEFDFRILPPHPDMDGLPYFERISWNIGDKILTSKETFGQDCVIEQEIAKAKALVEKNKTSKNPEYRQAATDIAKLLNDWMKCKKKSEYLIPIITLEDDGQDYKPGEVKLLSCGATVVKDILNVMSNRKYQNGTENGVADREIGRNFTLTKSGEKKDTKYSVQPWPDVMEMPESFYREDKLPNPVAYAKKTIKSDEHVISVVRNYLYGDPIIEDAGAADEDVDSMNDTPAEETPRGAKGTTTSGRDTMRNGGGVFPEAELPESRPSRPASNVRGRTTRGRNILDDMQNE